MSSQTFPLKTTSNTSVWWQAMRPKTLSASIAPILVGTCLALPHINPFIALVSLVCALALQITVNFANDYFDAKSGVDTQARLGPTRATASGLISPKQMQKGIVISALVAALLGLILIAHGGWVYVLLGLVSLVAALTYSGGPYPLASHGLGEVTVFVFFGLVAVLGSLGLHQSNIGWLEVLIACMFGCTSAAIMLVNNIRDINTDRKANKHTLAVRLGEQQSRTLYAALLTVPMLIALLLGLVQPIFLALLPMVLPAITLHKRFSQSQEQALNALLAQTAKWQFQLSLVLALLLMINAGI